MKTTTLRYFFAILCILSSKIIVSDHKKLKEGFLKGTQVKTVQGYKPIESIKVGDVIVGADRNKNCRAAIVEAVKRKKVTHYLRLLMGDQVVKTGAHQRFLNEKGKWISAKKIKDTLAIANDQLDVPSAERIKKKAYLYALQVRGHKFLITQKDILVHNAHVAVAQYAQIAVGYLTLTNPIQAKIGFGINLNDAKAHVNKQLSGLARIENFIKAPSVKKECSSGVLEERNCYLKHKQELTNLCNQFIQVKTDIENQSRLFHISSPADYILAKINLNLGMMSNPTLEQEANFNTQQANGLRQLRVAELMRLEDQIKELQIAIGIHFEAAYAQYLDASQQYDESYCSLMQSINGAKNENLATWLECFDKITACELRLKKLEDNIKIVKPLFDYYKNAGNACILRETSNIRERLNGEAQILNDEIKIAKNRSMLCNIKIMLDPELRYHGINTFLRAEGHAHDYGVQYTNFQSQIKKCVEDARLTLHYPAENPQRDCVLAKDAKDDTNKDTAKEEKQKKKIEDLVGNAKPGEKTSRTTQQFELPGGYEDACKDFEGLELYDIKDIATGKRGRLQDGRMVNVRYKSKETRPTLEIYNPDTKCSIKFRYGDKVVQK